MFEGRRPMGRLFYLLLAIVMTIPNAQAQGPATTTISDTVYRADGNPAGGVLLIFWPAFTTADGHTVAAGAKRARRWEQEVRYRWHWFQMQMQRQCGHAIRWCINWMMAR